MDWVKKYQELKERVEGLTSTEEEKKRIKKEEELFASRGWEEYIALTHTILSRIDAFPLLSATAGGTVFNSLFLNKAGRKEDERFRTEGYEKLEKGPLVLSLKAQGSTYKEITMRMREVYVAVDKLLASSSFYYESLKKEPFEKSEGGGRRIVVTASLTESGPLEQEGESYFIIDGSHCLLPREEKY